MEAAEIFHEENGGDTGVGILRPGHNCWRIERARRVSFLIDAAAYFRAFYDTVKRARRSVYIVGWDIDSRIDLLRQNGQNDPPSRLGQFLNRMARGRRGLHVYILTWDFAMVFALGREIFPVFRLPWKRGRRLHFHLDGEHPIGACHHQKIVVVDDAVAFVGGIDLSKRRWDTPGHEPGDSRRKGPAGELYRPVHDVQMAVDGAPAAALGELVRDRWEMATGRRLQALAPTDHDPWPPSLEPDMEDAPVAIARTYPYHKGHKKREAVQEVRALYVDAVKAARRFVYIENQYLTSHTVAKALAESLEEEKGPEIVVVLPRECDGWLEQTTMGILRFRALQTLRRSDRYKRLAVYFPHIPGLGGQHMNVHAKLMIADDTFLRVGSANLSNRSMGVDSECDLAVECPETPALVEGVRKFRHRLLAEHLQTTPEKIAEQMERCGSLIETIETLRGQGRTLSPLDRHPPDWSDGLSPAGDLADPEEPIAPESLVEEFLPEPSGPSGKKRLWALAVVVGLLLAAAGAWRWTPLGDWLDLDTLQSWARLVRRHPAGPLMTVGFYGIASLAVVPVTVLLLVTVFVFGPFKGMALALSGCVFAAALTYYLGHLLGRESIRRFAGTRVNRLSRRLGRRGLIAIVAVRIIPLAPFTVVNMVAGATHIRFRDFMLGTVFGMTPGIVAITILENQLERTIYDPSAGTIALLVAVAAAIIAAGIAAKRWLGKRSDTAAD